MKSVIIDLQHGDVGKGRVSAFFARDYEWSVRFNGGPNAGHTVYDGFSNVHKFHHLPAGAVYGKKIALDVGMVIDIDVLKNEIHSLGRPIHLYISENVHIIQPQHLTQDAYGSGIGSTKRGIAYVYSDRALRKGLRAKDYGIHKIKLLLDFDDLSTCELYSGLPPFNGESALYEGAQGIMLDVDYGCYPFVTSSSVMPSMAHKIEHTIGVMKAYHSRVGDGPPNHPDVPELRDAGQEYGTTTGRPRKCCWNDSEQLNYAMSIVQPDEIVVTKLDVLRNIKDISVYENDSKWVIGELPQYKAYLVKKYPKIKWFSESPFGDMVKIK